MAAVGGEVQGDDVVVLTGTRRQLIARCAVPFAVAVGSIVGRALVPLPAVTREDLGGAVAATAVGASLVAVVMCFVTYLFVRNDRVEIASGGISVYTPFKKRSLPWPYVRQIHQSSSFGERFITIIGPDVSIKAYAPSSGWWFFRDPEFEAKATVIMDAWRAFGRPPPPAPVVSTQAAT